uniref:Uncharacterized protein LOC111099705 n=1 Tax=Crassostrea virginica TaxID=6565 RepID=A0A8B8A6P2_CRAVI|nr:uncharacterized protein LOC111099705 [Crassostrea virginica]
MKSVKEIQCAPCLRKNTQVRATQFCKTCNDSEPLCDVCSQHHTSQNEHENHELSEDLEKCNSSEETTLDKNYFFWFSYILSFFSWLYSWLKSIGQHDAASEGHFIRKDARMQIACKPCNLESITAEATKCCKTCKDPEPLCDLCAQRHTLKAGNEGHEMSDDLQQFFDPTSEKQSRMQITCKPCNRESITAKATKCCKTCKDTEPLCDLCAKRHTLKAGNAGHEMSDDLQQFFDPTSEKEPRMNITCKPCNRESITAKATKCCKTCKDPEPLCDLCAQRHTLKAGNKGHEMSDDLQQFFDPTSEKEPRMNITCKPCNRESITAEATKCCKTCKDPEPLCDLCAQRHTLKAGNKGHEMSDDLQQFFDPTPEKEPRMNITCKPCNRESITAKATKCCKTCKDPEPLCDLCAQRHTLKAGNKGHEMSGDLQQFFDPTPEKEPRMNITCRPCNRESITAEATKCCKTCKDPEPLCDLCAQRHTLKAGNKGHEMSGDLQQFFDPTPEKEPRMNITCKPCNRESITAKATKCCKTCKDPEPLCDLCAQRHTLKAGNKGHEMSDDLQQFFDPTSEKKSPKTCKDQKPLPDDCEQRRTLDKANEKYKKADDLKSSSSTKSEKKCGDMQTRDEKVPGKPLPTEIKSNLIKLFWEKPQEKVDYFHVRYKVKNGNSKWKIVDTKDDSNSIIIKEMMANTIYVFQVRGVFGDLEGTYGPVSEDIATPESTSAKLLKACKRIAKTKPPRYRLPIKENKKARNSKARTKQMILGKPCQNCNEKSIMLVGATGSGKSTLVDGIINYILGVNFEDPFRFSMVILEDDEKKTSNQAQSQTEWITVYTIYPTEGSVLDFTLHIIDTPGFGDTRGIERDNVIVEQIRNLFSAQGEQGVIDIDAVCFIAKAPDARLTPTQKYIFSSIMSLFGKDIESNICTLITFADGATPAVLASLNDSKLPFGETYNFNNSALFAENSMDNCNSLSPMFWKMGCNSFEGFFKHILKLQTKSLRLTKSVLNERNQLKTIITNVLPQVTEGLTKITELKKEQEIVKQLKNTKEDNKDFEYEVTETRQVEVKLEAGVHVTNCLTCNRTCHRTCYIPENKNKGGCAAMDSTTGKCKVCPNKCHWTMHVNNDFFYESISEKKKKTYEGMKKKYEEATGLAFDKEKFIEKAKKDVELTLRNVTEMMRKVNKCRTRLAEIALTADPLTSEEYIDLLIESEKQEHKQGFQDRIKVLENVKKLTRVDKEFKELYEQCKDQDNLLYSETVDRLLED